MGPACWFHPRPATATWRGKCTFWAITLLYGAVLAFQGFVLYIGIHAQINHVPCDKPLAVFLIVMGGNLVLVALVEAVSAAWACGDEGEDTEDGLEVVGANERESRCSSRRCLKPAVVVVIQAFTCVVCVLGVIWVFGSKTCERESAVQKVVGVPLHAAYRVLPNCDASTLPLSFTPHHPPSSFTSPPLPPPRSVPRLEHLSVVLLLCRAPRLRALTPRVLSSLQPDMQPVPALETVEKTQREGRLRSRGRGRVRAPTLASRCSLGDLHATIIVPHKRSQVTTSSRTD